MSELLPCPHCNSPAAFKKVPKPAWGQDPHPDEGGEYIECTNNACAARSMMIFPTIRDAKPFLVEKWNRRSTPAASPIDSSPAYSSSIGADPAIEVGGTFNRRLDAVRVEDYERAIAGIKWLPSGYCTPDYIGDFLIGRARAIARQRGESNGRS